MFNAFKPLYSLFLSLELNRLMCRQIRFLDLQQNFSWEDPFYYSIKFHLETSHLICIANQMRCFYMKTKK